MNYRSKLRKREITPKNVFIASLFGGLDSLGLINQTAVNIATRLAGKKLAIYAEEKRLIQVNEDDTIEEQIREIIATLNSMFSISPEVGVEFNADTVTIKTKTDKCNICPGYIAEDELEGEACPVYGLTEAFLKYLTNGKIREVEDGPHKTVKKDDGWCYDVYAIVK